MIYNVELLRNDDIGNRLANMCKRAKERCYIATWSLGSDIENSSIKAIFEKKGRLKTKFIMSFGIQLNVDSVKCLHNVFGKEVVLRHKNNHSKLFIVDEEAIFGSANLSMPALTGGNNEVCAYTKDPKAVKKLVTWFEELADEACMITDGDLIKLVKSQKMNPIKDTSVDVEWWDKKEVVWDVPLKCGTPLQIEKKVLKQLLSEFKEAYQGLSSFAKPTQEYLDDERNYKVQTARDASTLFRHYENHDIGALEFLRRFDKEIVQQTNLVLTGQHPALKWNEGIKGLFKREGLVKNWAKCLSTVVNKPCVDPKSLREYTDVVMNKAFQGGKWNWLTFPLSVLRPDLFIFVKPTTFEEFFKVRLSMDDQTFSRKCSFERYIETLDLCNKLAGNISVMHPQDYIDIQSFIWVESEE